MRDARAHFSKLLDKATSEGPQTLTRNGKRVAVLVSAEDWDRQSTRKGNLWEFFAPLREAGVVLESPRDPPRDVDL